MKRYLIKNDTVYMPAIKKFGDDKQLIILENIRILTSLDTKVDSVVIPDEIAMNAAISKALAYAPKNLGVEKIQSETNSAALMFIEQQAVRERYDDPSIGITLDVSGGGQITYSKNINPFNEGDSFISEIVDVNGKPLVSNMYLLFGDLITQVTFSSSLAEIVFGLYEDVLNIFANKPNNEQVILTDGTNEMDAGYIPTKQRDVMTKEITDSAILQADIKISDNEARITALENSGLSKVAKGKWLLTDANISGSATASTDNSSTFNIPTVDNDGDDIIREPNQNITFVIKGAVTGVGTFEKTFNLFADRLAKDVIVSLRESNGSNLELLLASFDSTFNTLLIERTSGDDLDFTSLRVDVIEQETFVSATDIAYKTDLTVKQDKVDQSITKGSYTNATDTKAVVGKINEHTSAIETNEAHSFTLANNWDGQGYRERALQSYDFTSNVLIDVNDDVNASSGSKITLSAANDYKIRIANEKSRGGVLINENHVTGKTESAKIEEVIKIANAKTLVQIDQMTYPWSDEDINKEVLILANNIYSVGTVSKNLKGNYDVLALSNVDVSGYNHLSWGTGKDKKNTVDIHRIKLAGTPQYQFEENYSQISEFWIGKK